MIVHNLIIDLDEFFTEILFETDRTDIDPISFDILVKESIRRVLSGNKTIPKDNPIHIMSILIGDDFLKQMSGSGFKVIGYTKRVSHKYNDSFYSDDLGRLRILNTMRGTNKLWNNPEKQEEESDDE